MGEPWWLTNVYGPTARANKAAFLLELRTIHANCLGPWLICGDFNLIYKASDKNNGRRHHGLMRSFGSTLDDLQLEELHLSGRLFTWSSSRDRPTLEWLDRAFAMVEWLEQYGASRPTAPITRRFCSCSTPSRGHGRVFVLTSTRPSLTASWMSYVSPGRPAMLTRTPITPWTRSCALLPEHSGAGEPFTSATFSCS